MIIFPVFEANYHSCLSPKANDLPFHLACLLKRRVLFPPPEAFIQQVYDGPQDFCLFYSTGCVVLSAYFLCVEFGGPTAFFVPYSNPLNPTWQYFH